MDHALIALLNWAVSESSPLLAGFIGGAIAEAVVMLATKGESAVPRAVRIQIVLIWMVLVALMLVNINQGQKLAELVNTR